LRRDRAAGLLGQILVHHHSATRAQIGTVLDHARGDLRNFGNFGAAQAKRASAVKAKLAVDDSAETDVATASSKPAWRSVRVRDAVLSGSRWFAGSSARC
jgi:hypothetical protein